MSLRRVATAAAAGCAVWGAALAGPGAAPPGAPGAAEVVSVEPSTVFDEARRAYRGKPVADRISMVVRSAAGARLAGTMVFRAAGIGEDLHVALELDQLRVHAADGVVRAMLVSNPETYFEAAYAPPLTPRALDQALRPLALVPLALAAREAGEVGLPPLSVLPEVRWREAEVSLEEAKRRTTVRGLSPWGAATLTLDAGTGRFLALEAALHDGSRLEMTAQGIAPGEPAAWAIPLEGRERVARLGDLVRRRTELRAGDAAPLEAVRGADGRGVALVEGDRLALVVFRGEAVQRAAALARELAESGPPAPAAGAPTAVRAALVAAVREAPADEAAWAALRTAAGGLTVLAAPESSLARVAPGANVAVLVVDGRGRAAVVRGVGAEEDPARVAAEVRAALAK